MNSIGAWHRPGKWLVNPAYWDPEVVADRPNVSSRVQFIDCTLSEGDDCVGHQLNWNSRLAYLEKMDRLGVGEVTMPSHATFAEERDLIRAYRRLGLKTRIVAKGPGVTVPLKSNWKDAIDRHVDLGCEVISPIYKWPFEDTLSDFSAKVSKTMVVDVISETIPYMKSKGVRVVPWIVDAMRTPLKTACLFFGAMAKAGADGVYIVDSRGNSVPAATKWFVQNVRKAVGPSCDVYVQHHNDLGVATANALAAVEGGANWIDCSVLGIGDRGGCVAIEEAAPLFEMYGIQTGIKLDLLYGMCRFVQDAYGLELPPWKPIAGSNWNKEEGAGHLEGAEGAEATIGIHPAIVGREFVSVIGSKILFGRERSSAHSDNPIFLRELLDEWGFGVNEDQFAAMLLRARAAVATAYQRHYITIDEFKAIAQGVIESNTSNVKWDSIKGGVS